jgi:Ca2+-binding EF-hand superfamily protein
VAIFLSCIRAAGQFEDVFSAIKVTGLGRPELLEEMAHILSRTPQVFSSACKHDETATIDLEMFSAVCLLTLVILMFETWYFVQGLEKLGVDLSREEFSALFDEFDADGNGRLDLL